MNSYRGVLLISEYLGKAPHDTAFHQASGATLFNKSYLNVMKYNSNLKLSAFTIANRSLKFDPCIISKP